MARPEKSAAVAEITERFKEANAALLTEYRGLKVGEIAEVRGTLRDANAEYKVLKNTLTRIAVREVGLEELVEKLEGPTAIAFCKGDAVDAAKALDDAAKKYPVLVIKGGVLLGKILDADQARELAKLEPRDVQLAKIAMMANQPIQQTVNVFSALLRDLGSMLAQVVTQKEADAPAEAPAADAATEAPADDGATEVDTAEPPAAEADTAEPAPEVETLENPDVGPGSETDDHPADDASADQPAESEAADEGEKEE